MDLDHVPTQRDDLRLWVEKLIAEELHDTYIERSIGGEGLHGFLRGGFTGGGIKQTFANGSGFELYCTGRYFVISGKPYNGFVRDHGFLRCAIAARSLQAG